MIKNRILEIRQQRKLSAEKLADIVGTTQSTIHRLETGKRQLTHEWMEKIGKALNVSPSELLPTANKVQGYKNEVALTTGTTILTEGIEKAGESAFYKILSGSLDRLGLKPGEVRIFKISKKAIETATTGNVVIAKIVDENDKTNEVYLLRQYVEPCLLIANSNYSDPPNINMRKIHAEIIAILPN